MNHAPDPIVILGAPRSGTTFLGALLNAHPLVHVTHEMRLFAWAHHCLEVAPRDQRLLVTDRDAFVAHAYERFPAMIRDFYVQRRPQKPYWGDKNPHYADPSNRGCLETTRRLFPGAKFIHIVRDGRDVVASLTRRRHDDGRPWADVATASRVWRDHVTIGSAFGRGIAAPLSFEIRYEELVRDEAAWAVKLFDFLGIPLDPAVTAFCARERAQRTVMSTPTRDISAGVLVSEWTSALSEADRAASLAIMGDVLREFGYLADGGGKS